MKIKDFEQAIAALGVDGLEITKIVLSTTIAGQVNGVYGQRGDLTFLWWDEHGRGFRFDVNPNVEGCTVVSSPEYLDYRRATEFDLKFD